MTTEAILSELKSLGSESYKNLMMRNHGVREPCYGVKIGDLKKIQKRIKKDYQLALDLYATGNYDAMYLAGLIADDSRMTKKNLEAWAKNATGGALAGYTVPWVAAGSPHGWELGLEWIDSPNPQIATVGWNTLGFVTQLKPDNELEISKLKALLARVQKEIHNSADQVRYAMNQFIIMLGGSVIALTELARATAEKVGTVKVDMGNNSCQVPSALDYLAKIEKAGQLGRKKKTVKC